MEIYLKFKFYSYVSSIILVIILIFNFQKFIDIFDSTRHLSFRTSKDLQRKEIADSSMTDEKQILISYVRAEAAHHAIALKQELSSLGYSVYLVRCLLGKVTLSKI